MRREMMDAERKLWFLLRDRRLNGAKFRRQAPVGPYIADFVCLRRKVIVEADGGQHYENPKDAVRDQWLEREGYKVVRYSNIDILKNPEGVLTDLLSYLVSPLTRLRGLASAQPPSPPSGRGCSSAPASNAMNGQNARCHPLPSGGEGGERSEPGEGEFQSINTTTVPFRTIFASASASQLVMRTQPCESTLPTLDGSDEP